MTNLKSNSLFFKFPTYYKTMRLIILSLLLIVVSQVKGQEDRYYFKIHSSDDITKDNPSKCLSQEKYSWSVSYVYSNSFSGGSKLTNGKVIYGTPTKFETTIKIGVDLKPNPVYNTNTGSTNYIIGHNTYRLSVYQKFARLGCVRHYTRTELISVDDPIFITDVVFVNSGGKELALSHACIENNYTVRVKTASFYHNKKDEYELEIYNKYGKWQRIKTNLSSNGQNNDFTSSELLSYVNYGQQITFRTKKKQLDDGYSYKTSNNYLYIHPKFTLSGSIQVKKPDCKGGTPVIRVPLPKNKSYNITIGADLGDGYNFLTSKLNYDGTYYLIDENTKIENSNCTSNCYPKFSPNRKYYIEIEELNNINAPCTYVHEFTVPSMPDFTMTYDVPYYPDNTGKDVHIKKIGGVANFTVDISGSTHSKVSVKVGGHTFNGTLYTSQMINGVQYYSGSIWASANKGYKTFSVENSNGCITTAPEKLIEETTPISYTTVVGHPDCDLSALEGNKTATIRITNLKGGIGTYSFSHGASKEGSDYVLKDVPVSGSSVNISVTDESSNPGGKTVPISIPSPVLVQTSTKAPTMYCVENGTATVTNTQNGQAPYMYSAVNNTLNFVTSNVVEGYAEGGHDIFVQDNLGCVYGYKVNIPEAPQPIAKVKDSITAPKCYEYTDGQYRIKLSNILGELSAASNDARVQSSDITIKSDTVTVRNLGAGTYPITVTDTYNGNSCDTTFTFTIPEKPALNIASKVAPVIGKGTATGKITFDISGGNPGQRKIYLYDEMSLLDSLVTDVANGLLFDSLAGKYEDWGKPYYIEVIDGSSCSYSEDNFEKYLFKVKEPEDTLKIGLGLVSPISCNGMSDAQIKVIPFGGWEKYRFSHRDTNNFRENSLFIDLGAGQHTFFLTDSMGALDSMDFEIIMPGVITSSIDFIDSVKCFGTATGSVLFNITGGTPPFRHSLMGGVKNWKTGGHATELAEGNYTFVFADTNNCIGEDTLTVYVPTPDTLEFNKIDVTQTTCNTSNGKIAVEMKGGTSPYTYAWQNYQGDPVGGSPVLANLPQSGYFILDVKDKHGCAQHFEQAINPSNGPRIDSLSIEHVKCHGDYTGSAKVEKVTAATPYAPWWLTWSDGTEKEGASGFNAGLHHVAVTDTNNCVFTKYFEVTSPDSLWVSVAGSKAPHCYGYNDAFVEIEPHGGAKGYSYQWSNGDTTRLAGSLSMGEYSVILTDSFNCAHTKTFTIGQPEEVLVDLGNDLMMCPGNSHVLDGQGFSQHQWSSGEGALSEGRYLTVNKAGTYHLKVTDSIGCMAWDSIEIAVGNNALEADFLLSSFSGLGDTLRLYEVSNMSLDSMKWEFDTGAFEAVTPAEMDDYILWLKTNRNGMFNVGLYAYSGGCFSKAIKQVEILNPGDSTGNYYELLGHKEPLIEEFVISPNPNNGYFNVSIKLRKESDIKLLIFGVNSGTKVNERSEYGLDEYTISYQLEGIGTGVYLVVLTAEKERRQIKMIIE